MSLEEFEHAEGQEGYLYELSRGIITVSDVPNRRHLLLVAAIRDQLQAYKVTASGSNSHHRRRAANANCSIGDLDSERHPDLVGLPDARRPRSTTRTSGVIGSPRS